MMKEVRGVRCTIDLCDRPARSREGGLCDLHRVRLNQRGTTDDPPMVCSLRLQEFVIARCAVREALEDGPCWEFEGPVNRRGYGLIAPSLAVGTSRLLHRVAYIIAYGEVPDGVLVCHHCDNPPCYRASHLFLGSHADNMADMVAKGRQNRLASRPRKVSTSQVAAIRRAHEQGAALVVLAELYGVSPSFLSRLVRGQRRPDG